MFIERIERMFCFVKKFSVISKLIYIVCIRTETRVIGIILDKKTKETHILAFVEGSRI